ncbi:MAG TPA: hypothetical protein VN372_15855, partial [Methanospirillum sp.]|nr:hypothetical protein [Methanospirillum sp.]
MKFFWLQVSLLGFCFFIPINVYFIGSGQGVGIQTIFYRYQETYLGDNLITIVRDAEYVLSETVTGKTATGYSLWILGSLLVMIALIYFSSEGRQIMRTTGFFLVMSGICFLLSMIFQYGIILHNNSGFCIPFGIPTLIL